MKTGVCPKCGGRDVRMTSADIWNAASQRNFLPVKVGWFRSGRLLPRVLLNEFVCLACGYVETYVADLPKDREFLDKQLPRANVSAIEN